MNHTQFTLSSNKDTCHEQQVKNSNSRVEYIQNFRANWKMLHCLVHVDNYTIFIYFIYFNAKFF